MYIRAVKEKDKIKALTARDARRTVVWVRLYICMGM